MGFCNGTQTCLDRMVATGTGSCLKVLRLTTHEFLDIDNFLGHVHKTSRLEELVIRWREIKERNNGSEIVQKVVYKDRILTTSLPAQVASCQRNTILIALQVIDVGAFVTDIN